MRPELVDDGSGERSAANAVDLRVERPRACSPAPRLSTETGDPAPLRVLVVDDDTSTRRLLRTLLEHSAHFTVVGEADDGEKAVSQAGALRPDLVLLDYLMPRSNGASALAGILEVCPSAMVVIVSGATRMVGEPLLDAGAAALLPKGIPPFELLSRLGMIVGRSVSVESMGRTESAPSFRESFGVTQGVEGREERTAVVFVDDPVARHLIKNAFEELEVAVIIETEVATTLLAAVDLAAPAFVVIELTLNGQPDTSVLSGILQRSPRSIVIVYSEFAEWEDRALAVGARAFVLKPRIDELIDELRRLVPRR